MALESVALGPRHKTELYGADGMRGNTGLTRASTPPVAVLIRVLLLHLWYPCEELLQFQRGHSCTASLHRIYLSMSSSPHRI
jgi:hypothetical protein